MKSAVIIPAFNEEDAIGKVIAAIPKSCCGEIIVINNASTDNTERVAKSAGAIVLQENNRGYGFACLKGIEYLKSKPENEKPEIIIFLDGDFSDFPEEIPLLLEPIQDRGFDLVIGSRVSGEREKGSLTVQQVFGNWLATRLIRMIYGVAFSDLGPFRAIRYEKLIQMNMQDTTYGWTVEMQVKAAKQKLQCTEVPVRYRKRIGTSKISGTLKGSILAGYKILLTIFKNL